jgi:hypothetical protein
MRSPVFLSAILILIASLAACGTAPVIRAASNATSPGGAPASTLQESPLERTVQFLVSTAATDFHLHSEDYYPAQFRGVRIGHLVAANGEKQYILCGQFLPQERAADAEWTAFATIKTDPYEQWVGAQASGLCQQRGITWSERDLSSVIQNQLDSLQQR